MHLEYFGLLPLLCAAAALYAISVSIYRWRFHPLAKYPGPVLAKLTSLYDMYHCWKGDRHLDQYQCHQKYGPFVRYSPNYLIVNSADGMRDVYGSAKSVQKAKAYTYLQDRGAVSTNSVIDRTIHAHKRRLLSHAFSESALKSLEPYMIQNIDTWLDVLGSGSSGDGWSPPRNMANYANYLTFDVLGDLCFGKSFDMINSESLREIPSGVLARLKLFQIVGNGPLLPYWKLIHEKLRIDQYLLPDIARRVRAFVLFAAQAIDERMARGLPGKETSNDPTRKDFTYWLSIAKDPVTGESFSQKDMWAESTLLIGAGSDTTAITIAATFFFLLKNPKICEKLQEELRSTFTGVEDIHSGQQLTGCHYLRAVIQESLRIAPPVPSSIPRESADDGVTVDGQYIPPGITIGSSIYTLHHNKDYFQDPFTYWPERWIVDSKTGVTQEDVETAKSAFAPFSLGPRGCIGKNMAYLEASIALARVLYRFDIRLKKGDKTGATRDGQYEMKDVFLVTRDGPMVEFKEHKT